MKPVYLRTRREALGLMQTDLEARSGVAQNTISKLERNAEARPDFRTVVALAAALGVRADRLIFGPDPDAERRKQAAKLSKLSPRKRLVETLRRKRLAKRLPRKRLVA